MEPLSILFNLKMLSYPTNTDQVWFQLNLNLFLVYNMIIHKHHFTIQKDTEGIFLVSSKKQNFSPNTMYSQTQSIEKVIPMCNGMLWTEVEEDFFQNRKNKRIIL